LGAEFLGLIITLPGTFPSGIKDMTALFAAFTALVFPALARPDGAIVKQDKQQLDEK
jgi:hypothetical protein